MRELRLIDPDGYTVPGTVNSNVPDENAAKVTDLLKREAAPKDAAEWTAHGFPRRACDYRVQDTAA